MSLKLRETSSGLGYREKAILLHIEDKKYLVISLLGIQDWDDCLYKLGETYDLEKEDLEMTDFNIKDSQLDSFLFDYFLKTKYGII